MSTRWVASAASVLLGLAAVAVPLATAVGPVTLRVGVLGCLAALASGWSRARWLAGATCFATVLLVLFGSLAAPMPVPAAAITGLLLLAYVVVVDLAGQVDGATLAEPGIASWGRDHAPAVVAALGGLLAVVAVLALPWRPGVLLVALAPALLAVAAMLAFAGARRRA